MFIFYNFFKYLGEVTHRNASVIIYTRFIPIFKQGLNYYQFKFLRKYTIFNV